MVLLIPNTHKSFLFLSIAIVGYMDLMSLFSVDLPTSESVDVEKKSGTPGQRRRAKDLKPISSPHALALASTDS